MFFLLVTVLLLSGCTLGPARQLRNADEAVEYVDDLVKQTKVSKDVIGNQRTNHSTNIAKEVEEALKVSVEEGPEVAKLAQDGGCALAKLRWDQEANNWLFKPSPSDLTIRDWVENEYDQSPNRTQNKGLSKNSEANKDAIEEQMKDARTTLWDVRMSREEAAQVVDQLCDLQSK